MLTLGVNTKLERLEPEFQVYVLAPDALRLMVLPAQTELADAEIDSTGEAITETLEVNTDDEVQPNELVPETEYVEETVGVTTAFPP